MSKDFFRFSFQVYVVTALRNRTATLLSYIPLLKKKTHVIRLQIHSLTGLQFYNQKMICSLKPCTRGDMTTRHDSHTASPVKPDLSLRLNKVTL